MIHVHAAQEDTHTYEHPRQQIETPQADPPGMR